MKIMKKIFSEIFMNSINNEMNAKKLISPYFITINPN